MVNNVTPGVSSSWYNVHFTIYWTPQYKVIYAYEHCLVFNFAFKYAFQTKAKKKLKFSASKVMK